MSVFDKLKKYDPEKEEKLRNEIEENGGLEKNDQKAMMLSAILIIVPVCLAVLGVICVLAVLIMGLFN